MDATTQTNTPSVPKLMADSFAAAQTQAQRGATTRTPAETEVTAKKREEPSTAPALSTDLSEWDIPLSQMVGQTTSNPSGQLYQRKRRKLLLAAADDDDASTSPQHIHQIPSPISNVPTEPTVQPTPPPPEASQQTSLQPDSQSSPQQSTQSASQHPSTSPQHIVPSVSSPQPSPSNPSNSQTSNKESQRIKFDISINSQSSLTYDNTKSPQPEVHHNQGMDIIQDSSPRPMGETELEGPHDFPLLAEPEKEPQGTDAAISSVPETTRPNATTTAEQGQPSARTLSGQDKTKRRKLQTGNLATDLSVAHCIKFKENPTYDMDKPIINPSKS
ncbi:mediator of DNA damage checkpoint protein 1-like [Camellia sinensis]|uniref:mediator of DNA damage checkpoint protein 1-like n=1 Tax=Camellia sinensis TaxID=4442 RepID=UPI001036841C|nr:mediator of DNA damage checkpoint protein 1-like [Camellia sinensis]